AWDALRQVPAGRTTTYRDLARALGRAQSARAVGQAVGANPVAVIVPCHRVLRSDGAISGFRWGVARKQQLLAREQVFVRAGGSVLSLG
ncbi:MAG: MGMT family protein, partial [Gemmatimonadetes bacterium]|nr:MGMT family protein [Gemmatimonadota bacterium]